MLSYQINLEFYVHRPRNNGTMRESYTFSTPYWNVVLALQLCGIAVSFHYPATDGISTQIYNHGHLHWIAILLLRIYFNVLTAK